MTRAYTLIALIALAMLACASALQTDRVPSELRESSVRYFVENHGKDQRRIDQFIASSLRSHGLNAESGLERAGAGEFDVLVLYEDRWQWDMSNYLIFLRIDFRDAETNALLATGSSYQSSLARKPEDKVVGQILEEMLGKR